MKKIIKYWAPVFFWASIIFTFSASKSVTAAPSYWQDFVIKKLAHMTEYAIFAVLQYRAYRAYGVNRFKASFLAILIAGLYGLTDELHQSFTPGREPRLRDVVFDTIGATAAIIILWNLLPIIPMKLTKWAKKWGIV